MSITVSVRMSGGGHVVNGAFTTKLIGLVSFTLEATQFEYKDKPSYILLLCLSSVSSKWHCKQLNSHQLRLDIVNHSLCR